VTAKFILPAFKVIWKSCFWYKGLKKRCCSSCSKFL